MVSSEGHVRTECRYVICHRGEGKSCCKAVIPANNGLHSHWPPRPNPSPLPLLFIPSLDCLPPIHPGPHQISYWGTTCNGEDGSDNSMDRDETMACLPGRQVFSDAGMSGLRWQVHIWTAVLWVSQPTYTPPLPYPLPSHPHTRTCNRRTNCILSSANLGGGRFITLDTTVWCSIFSPWKKCICLGVYSVWTL